MANKPVSALSPITAAELAVGDLLFVSDISTLKMAISEMTAYFQSAITSSLTSSNALTAKTASYLLYQGFPNGTASYALTSSYNISSSHSNRSDTASYVNLALSSSYAITASYAISASWCATSSVQLTYSSAYSEYAKTSSFLLYSGVANGTASYSLKSNNAVTSDTASFLSYIGNANGTASYAIYSALSRNTTFLLYSGTANGTASYALQGNQCNTANGALTSSFLTYNNTVPNGTASYAISSSHAMTSSYISTASYALTSENNVGSYKLYGPFAATLVSPETGAISISLTSSVTYPSLIFEFYGDHGIPFRLNPASAGKITVLATSPSLPLTTVTVAQCYAHAPYTGMLGLTGSVTQSFFLKSLCTSMQQGIKWEIACNATDCNFQNGYNPLSLLVYSNNCSNIKAA